MADLTLFDVPSLVSQYADAALANRRAIDNGDHRTANRHYEIVAAIYRELRRRGADAQRALLPLLTHPEPGVRAWAAAHAMEFAPADGEPVLTALTNAPKALGMSATMTLRQWREGKLIFP